MQKDLAWGLSNEVLLKTSIERVTGPLKFTGVYHVFDYFNDKSFVELKSRNCKSNTYPTTMVGMNKITFLKKNLDKEYYFFFKFEDGLFYWKYCEKIVDFDIKVGGRYDRGRPELNKYLYIPITELTSVALIPTVHVDLTVNSTPNNSPEQTWVSNC